MVKASRALMTTAALALFGTASMVAPPRCRAEPAAAEYEVKAVYLFNFARFVTWPASAFASPSAPLGVCILGHDPFGAVLDHTLANESVDGRPLAARRITNADGVEGCQLLFVGAADGRAHAALLRTLVTRPILTVGDDATFPETGGMVGFHLEDGSVRVIVSTAALRTAGLTMSSQLLRLARIVPGTP